MAGKLEALRELYRSEAQEAGEDGDDSHAEAISKEIFSNYRPSSRITRGLPHPGSISEATSLSAIQLPPSSYPLWDSISDDIVDSGKLSQLQLESVLYACTKHLTFLPNGQRAGFFIGDGAGVGKGRQIAGIVLDNYARGRRRALWLSTSSDLHHDAERDLGALGLHLQVVNNCQALDRETRAAGLAKDFQEGVLFMTYSTLTSSVKGRPRLQQVIDWLGGPEFDGPLVLDECHKAKNFVPGKEKQSTKVAAAVLALQEALPRARVVYCSATGVSEVQNMAYMARLGLWGPGTAFPGGFESFLDSMRKRGVTFLELLAMEMKSEGFYVARGLSFQDAEFAQLECPLTREQEGVYNAAVDFWKDLRVGLVDALAATNSGSREVWKPFWGAQQRFFKMLCISMKMPTVVATAREALAGGMAVVVGLQSTGEAAADALGLEPGRACGFISAASELLTRFVAQHFPTAYQPSAEECRLPEHAQPAEVPACVAAKAVLLQRAAALQLPPSFLDELIDSLGGPSAVAEMTGRRGRIVRNARGRGEYTLRAKPDSADMDSLNVKETAAFMAGKKLVAVVSDAASTGISLHASADAANRRRRLHLTVELPWSADKAIQQLGRSHRSNQTSAPVFQLVLSNLGGERRFAAAVARRLQSLGALTRGDRRAASGIDLSESNLDSPLGRKSLKRMYDCIVLGSPALPAGVTLSAVLEGCDAAEVAAVLQPLPAGGHIAKEHVEAAVTRLHEGIRGWLDVMCIGPQPAARPRGDTVAENAPTEQAGAAPKEASDVRRFLNRLLGVVVGKQNLMFNYFTATLAAEVRAAQGEGRYSEGVSDLPVAGVREAPPPQVVWTDPHSGLRTLRTDLVTDRGVPWEAALRALEHERAGPDDASGFRLSRRPMFGRPMVLLALQRGPRGGAFSVLRPNTGLSYFDMEVDELRQKYARVASEAAQAVWNEAHESSRERCMHGANCQQGPGCNFGRRLVAVSLLSGSIVRVWGVLESVLQRHEHVLSKADRTMRVVRVEFASGDRLIGVRYPEVLLPEVVAMLSAAQAMAPGLVAQPQLQHFSPGQLGGDALKAAALGARGATCAEPVSPVQPKCLAKAFRAPKTLLSFFTPRAAKGSPGGGKPAGGKAAGRAVPARPAAVKTEVMQLSDSDDGSPAAKRPKQELKQEPGGTAAGGGCKPETGAAAAADESTTEAEAEAELKAEPKAEGLAGRPLSEGNGRLNQLAARRPAAKAGQPELGGARRGGKAPAALAEESVAALLAMGFQREQAVAALKAAGGNLERAAHWLLQ